MIIGMITQNMIVEAVDRACSAYCYADDIPWSFADKDCGMADSEVHHLGFDLCKRMVLCWHVVSNHTM